MITKVIKFNKLSEKRGFITHADQDTDGIKFGIVYSSDTSLYVYTKVSDVNKRKVLNWIKRNNGTVMSNIEAKAEIQEDIDTKTMVTRDCDMGYTHNFDKVKELQNVLTAIKNI